MNNNILEQNIKAHDKIADKYDLRHTEIYNDIEQNRLSATIKKLLENFNGNNISVLDFGAGTGNLTSKFLKHGCRVTACDISKKILDVLKEKKNSVNLQIKQLDGEKLPFKNNNFNITATYSVLHHIPDYLYFIKEMVRVTKHGGYIYIDHEANDNKWSPDKNLSKYYKLAKLTKLEHIKKLIKARDLLTLSLLKTIFIKLFVNKRYKREGDIHVWKDDHIEWERILKIFKSMSCEVISNVDFLLYRPKVSIKNYNFYKDRCSDMKYVIAKKY